MIEINEGRIDVSPREARYDEGRLALLQAAYAQLVESGRVHGASFLMARDGKVFAHRAMGRRSFEPGSGPLLPGSVKGIASITKVITATAVMKLVEDGVLWLDQPVSTLVEEMRNPAHGQITLWHLLTHTSGLAPDGGYYAEPYPVNLFERLEAKGWLQSAALAGPPRFAPGEQWAYSSVGYVLLAEVVARASGRSYPRYVAEEIFGPLGMEQSGFAIPEARWPEVAWVGPWQLDMQRAIASGAAAGAAPPGGGGAYSTLQDLFRLGQCFLEGGTVGGRRVLGKKAVQEMTRNQLAGVPAFHWGHRLKDFRHGLGWGFYGDGIPFGPATFLHAGWGWCSLIVDPVERFVFVAFLQDARDFDPDLQVKPPAIAFSGLR
jgi:CubicO group peptidase (beta-lactamase class C family)